MKFLEMLGGLVLFGGVTAGAFIAGAAGNKIDDAKRRERDTFDVIDTLKRENRELLREKDASKDKTINELKEENAILKKKNRGI